MTLAYAVIFIVALLGNSFGLFMASKKSPFNSVTNLFIANMAVADLLLTVTAMPYSVAFLYLRGFLFGGTVGTITCKAMLYAIRVSIAATVLTMTLISFDRFCVVFYPLRGKFFRKPRIVSAIIWALSFILMVPTLLFYKVRTYVRTRMSGRRLAQQSLAQDLSHLPLLYIVCAPFDGNGGPLRLNMSQIMAS